MRYEEFRNVIRGFLEKHPSGLSWSEIKDKLQLPYSKPCPTWVQRLEQEIGLVRARGPKTALIWKIFKG